MYKSRHQFELDVRQIKENSLTYNGPQSVFTQTAECMVQVGLKTLEEVGVVVSVVLGIFIH